MKLLPSTYLRDPAYQHTQELFCILKQVLLIFQSKTDFTRCAILFTKTVLCYSTVISWLHRNATNEYKFEYMYRRFDFK